MGFVICLAQEIAYAAMAWGQTADITVVTGVTGVTVVTVRRKA